MTEPEDNSSAEPTEEVLTIGGVRGFIKIVKHFVPFALPYWDKLILRVLLQLVGAVLGLCGALATGRLVDALTAGSKAEFFAWATLALVMAVGTFGWLFCWVVVSLYMRLRLDLKLKRLIFDHVQRMSLSFHESRPIGENMYRINNDTTFATDITISVVVEFFERLIPIMLTLTVLLALNPLMAKLIAVYITIHFIFSHLIMNYGYRLQTQLRQSQADVSAILQEGLSSYAISKAMSRERHELRRFFNRSAKFLRAWLGYFIVEVGWAQGTVVLHEILRQPVFMLLCGYLVITGKMTVGDYVALQGLLWYVMAPLIQLVYTIQRFRIACVPAQRMLQTLDLVPEVQDAPDAVKLTNPRGSIAFEHIHFRYNPEGPYVIKDLSFTLDPGKKLAIVGVSGAGKTSIFNLLMRFAKPSQGSVLIDGIDLSNIQLDSYLERVSVVLQDNFLFSATIRDNILMGNIHATEAELDHAIARAGLGSTIEALPDGLDTVLLEGGNLSMGQKQRIAIARAVIRDPLFLYLDEATSALDPVTEAEILEQLAEIEEGRTRIVIAHHIASVHDADEILVMEHGVCVQRGRHEELVDVDGAYKRLWAAEKEGSADSFASGEASA